MKPDIRPAEGEDKSILNAVHYRNTLEPGDLGYMIHLHGKLYAQEEGYSLEFEGYVAKTFYEFTQHYNPEHDRFWLALYNDEIVACIAILRRSSDEAQLRWFLVAPAFRGLGIGRKLFEEALAYCRARFSSVYLMTADTQQKAIALYKAAGFKLTSSVKADQWGKRLSEERYDLILKEKR